MQWRPPDRPRAWRPACPPVALQTTTTDDSQQNSTAPLGGPVIRCTNCSPNYYYITIL